MAAGTPPRRCPRPRPRRRGPAWCLPSSDRRRVAVAQVSAPFGVEHRDLTVFWPEQDGWIV
uniref:Uncharacterized protein n=1 Tax=Setaria italica TaxID=4555 RepID=K4A281_SETIT